MVKITIAQGQLFLQNLYCRIELSNLFFCMFELIKTQAIKMQFTEKMEEKFAFASIMIFFKIQMFQQDKINYLGPNYFHRLNNYNRVSRNICK